MTTNILLAILVTSVATYSSRFLGVLTSEKINEGSKIYRWFNCLAYSTLAALISRMIVFPAGVLAESDYFIRFIVILLSILIFFVLSSFYQIFLPSSKVLDFLKRMIYFYL